jgi:hypothetical protein
MDCNYHPWLCQNSWKIPGYNPSIAIYKDCGLRYMAKFDFLKEFADSFVLNGVVAIKIDLGILHKVVQPRDIPGCHI